MDINFSDFLYVDSGNLFWKVTPGRSRKIKPGDIAGSFSKHSGYMQLGLFHKTYLLHRVVWFLHNGPIPENMQVDHIDGDVLNNFIGNLRLVDNTANSLNRVKSELNKSGVTGVSWQADCGSWRVEFRSKYVCLKSCFLDACAERFRAERNSDVLVTNRHGRELKRDKKKEAQH